MNSGRDKTVIEIWLRLYNWLMGSSYEVIGWPDDDSSKPNVDAICRNQEGSSIAIEHTLVQPFEIEKQDNQRFMATLGALENDPSLIESGIRYIATQPVDAIPTGVDWSEVKANMHLTFRSLLPLLAVGTHVIRVETSDYCLSVKVDKREDSTDSLGKFLTMRGWPGDPPPELVIGVLKRKVPKLAVSEANIKILLLEKDTAPGTIEAQLEKVLHLPKVQSLLQTIDQIWVANTMCLRTEYTLFTNQAYPLLPENETYSSLNVDTGSFWRVSR